MTDRLLKLFPPLILTGSKLSPEVERHSFKLDGGENFNNRTSIEDDKRLGKTFLHILLYWPIGKPENESNFNYCINLLIGIKKNYSGFLVKIQKAYCFKLVLRDATLLRSSAKEEFWASVWDRC